MREENIPMRYTWVTKIILGVWCFSLMFSRVLAIQQWWLPDDKIPAYRDIGSILAV